MKIVVASLFILLIATQAFSKWVMLLEFTWNRDYIAKNLCENRSKPQLKCGGKCQLMKRLAEEERDSAPGRTPSAKSAFEEGLFTATSFTVSTLPATEKKPGRFAVTRHWNPFFPPRSVFHPPLV